MTNLLPILDANRSAEVRGIRGIFSKPGRILELGGSDGFQARILADGGWDVASIDLAGRPKRPVAYFPVQDYDGLHIPFEDKSFDGVYSSNVLEHIPHLVEILAETRRVLRRGGIAVHILPSPAWRFWTTISHYPRLAGLLWTRRSGSVVPARASIPPAISSLKSTFLRATGLLPHGEYSNAVAELYYFSRSRWGSVFRASGFDIVSCSGGNMFYTGHSLLPFLPLSFRRSLSGVLGSACHIFVLRRV